MAAPVATLALLPTADRAENPHGNRYGPADRAAAYQLWRTVCARSLRRTAEQAKVSVSTVSRWAAEDAWEARADQEDAEENAGARRSLAVRVLPALDRGVRRLERIVDDEAAPPTAVVKAVELLANLAGVGPKGGGGLVPAPADPAAPKALPLAVLRRLTPDELDAWLDTRQLPPRLADAPAGA